MARNNRQHKKLHSGVHQKMGFEVEFDVAKSFDDPEVVALMDNFLFDGIECNGLVCGVAGVETGRALILWWRNCVRKRNIRGSLSVAQLPKTIGIMLRCG